MTAEIELTPREHQVLIGIADGKNNVEIGRELHISADTVKTHAQQLFKKLGVKARAAAVAVAYECGLMGERDTATWKRLRDLESRVALAMQAAALRNIAMSTEFRRGYETCGQQVRNVLRPGVVR